MVRVALGLLVLLLDLVLAHPHALLDPAPLHQVVQAGDGEPDEGGHAHEA